MNPQIETYRMSCLKEDFALASFSNSWPVWKAKIDLLTNGFTDPKLIFDLGGKLSEIFATTSVSGRGQGTVSGGGAAWECLVCWYLNQIMTGSRAVAMRPRIKLVPQCVRDATSIVYGTDQTNTESDIVVLVFPKTFKLDEFNADSLNLYVEQNIGNIELGVVQCKTNWNDNAQIPMLWDMVYRAKGFTTSGLQVGRNGFEHIHFKRFSYSFVTVPSQKDLSKFGTTKMPVKRVKNLSGGNYWGWPTKSGVALSISEIFNRNYSYGFDQNILSHVTNSVNLGALTSSPIK